MEHVGYVRHPAGPLPARVYWFRRIVVLVALALVIGLAVAIVGRIGADASDGEPDGGTAGQTATDDAGSDSDADSEDAASDDAGSDGADSDDADDSDSAEGDGAEESDESGSDEAESDKAEAATAEDAGAARECAPGDVEVTLASDATTYSAGKDPTFAVEVALVGEDPCLVDVNDATRELVIVSGPAHVWSSAECVDPEPRLLLLGPGQVDSQAIRWTRNRTDAACTPGLPDALPGTYRATVTLLGDQTDELVFTLG